METDYATLREWINEMHPKRHKESLGFSQWEQNFIDSIWHQMKDLHGLSQKQVIWINRLWEKYCE